MADIKFKRSAVEGKVPLTTDLELGQLAINTHDGKLFLKRNNTIQDYIVEIGGQVGFEVKNQTGATLSKGTVVKFAGTLGASGKLLASPFLADGTDPSEYVMGLVENPILNGDSGFVVSQGKIVNLSTNGFTEGAILYASDTTAGGLTATRPEAPSNKVVVAAVVHAHANNGILQVRVTPGSNIGNDELVEVASPSNGQTLVWSSANGRFENRAVLSRAIAAGATSGTLTPNSGTTDVFNAFGLTGAITIAAPSGTPTDGQRLMLRFEDNGTARGITWTTSSGAYRAVGVTLPTTTSTSKITYVGCVYNSTDLFWDVIAVVTQL